MNDFFPWFFEEFLPPLMPVIVAVAIVIEVVFWATLALGAGWLGKKILQRRRRRQT